MHSHHDVFLRLDQREVDAVLRVVVSLPLVQLSLRRDLVALVRAALGVRKGTSTLAVDSACRALTTLTIDDHGLLYHASSHLALVHLVCGLSKRYLARFGRVLTCEHA